MQHIKDIDNDIDRFKRLFVKFNSCLCNIQETDEAYNIVNTLYYHLAKKHKKYYLEHKDNIDYFYQLTYTISNYNDRVKKY